MGITKRINEIAVEFFEGNNSRFAERMGTSEANIRNYRSKITPKVDFLVKLCNELEISFDWLFNGTGPQRRAARQGDAVARDYTPNRYVSFIRPQSYPTAEDDALSIQGDEVERMYSEIHSLRETINTKEKTILSLEKIVSTQEKLIERLEKLLDPKSGGKTATDASRSIRSAPRQLDPNE